MPRILHITRWCDTFESADTRKRERLKYFHAPSGCDSRGYLNLVSRFPQEKALLAFGVFQALCQLSATLGRSVRGSFKNTDGTAMDIQQIACLVRIQECHLVAALEILCDEKVKWCRWEDNPANLPHTCHSSPGFVQGEGEGEGEVKGEGEEAARQADGMRSLASSPIQPPKHRAQLVEEALTDRFPTGNAAGIERIQKWINSMNPKWKARPTWIRSQLDELTGILGFASELPDSDWRKLRAYMHCQIPDREDWKALKLWQPDNRSMFVKHLSDVVEHMDRWAAECARRKITINLGSEEP